MGKSSGKARVGNLGNETAHRTLFRPNENKRRTDRQNVVNLRRMDDADEGIAHHENVQISGREYSGEACLRLIRQADDVVQFMRVRKRFHLVELAASANEKKRNACVRL